MVVVAEYFSNLYSSNLKKWNLRSFFVLSTPIIFVIKRHFLVLYSQLKWLCSREPDIHDQAMSRQSSMSKRTEIQERRRDGDREWQVEKRESGGGGQKRNEGIAFSSLLGRLCGEWTTYFCWTRKLLCPILRQNEQTDKQSETYKFETHDERV